MLVYWRVFGMVHRSRGSIWLVLGIQIGWDFETLGWMCCICNVHHFKEVRISMYMHTCTCIIYVFIFQVHPPSTNGKTTIFTLHFWIRDQYEPLLYSISLYIYTYVCCIFRTLLKYSIRYSVHDYFSGWSFTHLAFPRSWAFGNPGRPALLLVA